ncbi:signal peptidase I [Candidatus Woesearchaeota archaeon]|jgi:signal peptidase I|nr:signal peptidase I [Candidatus Woesearchaeota archaeon]|tara:strand:+ start:989 stop:1621 length:633 start_codon:yes stop_codon:yes gene_type:complete
MKKLKKTFFAKAWHFIWHEESLASWIVNIILAFIIIKYLVYPGLGLLFNTSFPVVAVVSPSMEHTSSFDSWWDSQESFYENFNITKQDFKQFYFKNGFNKGDIIVLFGTDTEKIVVGDVIVYYVRGKQYPIIHRVILVKNNNGDNDNKDIVFETKGDNNHAQIKSFNFDETNIPESSYIGKAVFRIPFLGYVKIWFVKLMSFIGLEGFFS